MLCYLTVSLLLTWGRVVTDFWGVFLLKCMRNFGGAWNVYTRRLGVSSTSVFLGTVLHLPLLLISCRMLSHRLEILNSKTRGLEVRKKFFAYQLISAHGVTLSNPCCPQCKHLNNSSYHSLAPVTRFGFLAFTLYPCDTPEYKASNPLMSCKHTSTPHLLSYARTAYAGICRIVISSSLLV